MKSAQKLVSLLVIVGAFFMAASSARASQLLNLSVTLSDSEPNIAATYTFGFTHKTSGTIKAVSFDFCTQPSGVNDQCSEPTNTNTTYAGGTRLGTISGLTDGDWTMNQSTLNGHPQIESIVGGQNLAANTIISIPFTGVNNPSIGDCNPATNNSTDTCYVRVRSWDNISKTGDPIDQGVASFTVVAKVTVSARVDPSFTFVVQSVESNTVHSAITTSVASTFQTLPFGSLTAGTPKYVAHALRVTTNTQNGYTVSAKMDTQMTGNYSQNNIDPFIAGWNSPTTWTEPTGSTPNDNTGWIGANTTDTDVSGYDGSTAKFGKISSTANIVMSASSSDNGTTPIYVTYAIEANVFQPADTYTGYLKYNALPTY